MTEPGKQEFFKADECNKCGHIHFASHECHKILAYGPCNSDWEYCRCKVGKTRAATDKEIAAHLKVQRSIKERKYVENVTKAIQEAKCYHGVSLKNECAECLIVHEPVQEESDNE